MRRRAVHAAAAPSTGPTCSTARRDAGVPRAGSSEVITPSFTTTLDRADRRRASSWSRRPGSRPPPRARPDRRRVIDDDSADALVVGGTDVRERRDGPAQAPRQLPLPDARSTLVKIDGEWLVDDFSRRRAGGHAVSASLYDLLDVDRDASAGRDPRGLEGRDRRPRARRPPVPGLQPGRRGAARPRAAGGVRRRARPSERRPARSRRGTRRRAGGRARPRPRRRTVPDARGRAARHRPRRRAGRALSSDWLPASAARRR